jgi:hypothetical protein
MAKWYPLSPKTVALLATPPAPGETHDWLPRAAGGVRHLLDPETCYQFLRHCCDTYVHHRTVPDREIRSAVNYIYGRGRGSGLGAYAWPDQDTQLVARTIDETSPLFDPDGDTQLQPAQVLPMLFRPGELVCTGPDSESAIIRPLEECLTDAHLQQFIVVNPMRGRQSVNQEGNPSVRCQNNVGLRRHLVVEFDDLTVTKAQQARLISRLARFVPLILVVDSGGKSLHAWFRVEQLHIRDQARFFAVACLLGADKSRWDSSGWLRMPGGLRVVKGVPATRQRILYESTH